MIKLKIKYPRLNSRHKKFLYAVQGVTQKKSQNRGIFGGCKLNLWKSK